MVQHDTNIRVYNPTRYKGDIVSYMPKIYTIKEVFDNIDNEELYTYACSIDGHYQDLRRIISLEIKKNKEIIRLDLTDDNYLVCEPNQLIWTNEGYKESDKLTKNNILSKYENNGIAYMTQNIKIISISYVGCSDVYSIRVEDCNNFFANNILVHE